MLLEVTSINSDTFNFGNINLNVKSTVPVPSVPKSTESYSSVNNTFSTLANISSWIPSSIGLRSLTVNPSTVKGLHDFSASNTVSIGIVVSDSSILIGDLATAYWIYSLEGSRIRMIRVQFRITGDNLEVMSSSPRFINETSVSPANQTDTYLSTAGSPSSGTQLSNVVVEYHGRCSD